MKPVWAKLKEDGYDVTVIDCDDRRDIADEYGIKSIPATIILEDGKEVERVLKAMPYSFMLDKLK